MTKYIVRFLIGILIFSKSFSSFGQSSVIKYSNNYYSAGVNSQTFNYIASIGKQRADNWCWAACTQMVLNYHGLYVTQEQIVNKCFGGLYNAPGGTLEMFTALNGWAYNTRGGASNIYTNNYPTNANEIQSLLANDWPLIVGLNYGTDVGHAYVLTAIYYSLSYDAYGNLIVIPDKVVLRDPWPYNNSRQEMSWAEFSTHVNMIYKVWIVDVPTYNSFYYKSMNYNEIKDYKFMIGTNFRSLKFMYYFKEGKYGLQAFWGRNKTESNNGSSSSYNKTTIVNKYGLDCRRVFRSKKRWTHFYLGPSIRFLNTKTTTDSTVYVGYPINYISGSSKSKINQVFLNGRFGAEFVVFNRFAINFDIGIGYLSKRKNLYADADLVLGFRF